MTISFGWEPTDSSMTKAQAESKMIELQRTVSEDNFLLHASKQKSLKVALIVGLVFLLMPSRWLPLPQRRIMNHVLHVSLHAISEHGEERETIARPIAM